jgi:filamentous hemagglutinin family protein
MADGIIGKGIQKFNPTSTILQTGNRYDITHDRVVHGNIALNHFLSFDLKAGEIANLYHAEGSTKLVNFVNSHIQVDGTVNSIVGSQIGGDLFFVSPMGMTVGTTGVINTGSLTALAMDAVSYAKYVAEMGAHINDKTLAIWQTGDVPLVVNNESGK